MKPGISRLDPPVYLDYAASTPLDPRVLEAMLPYLATYQGNPSSLHQFGRTARAALDQARDRAAAFLHADASEICFTGSGTEADNLAVIGAALMAPPDRRRVVISAVEHHAVLNTALSLRRHGFEVRTVPVSPTGALDLDEARDLIDDRTALVSVMLCNNETGVVFPVKKVARMAQEAGALIHTDAVQAASLLRLDPVALCVDLLSISAHKFCGPKGAGALYVRRGVKLAPVIYGGAQERERRAGTEDVAGLVGMGAAAEIALQERQDVVHAVDAARGAFLEAVSDLGGLVFHAESQKRLPSILSFAVTGVDAELLLMRLDSLGVAISTGAACASGSREPSHVLVAMGLPDDIVASSVRVSFGRACEPEACRAAGAVFAGAVNAMRALAEANAPRKTRVLGNPSPQP